MFPASVPKDQGEAVERMAGKLRTYATGLDTEVGRLRNDLYLMMWKRGEAKDVLHSMAKNIHDLDIRIGQVRLVLEKLEARK